MSSSFPRFVKMNDWIFEIKTVKAIRVEKFGEPYNAISNLSVMGESMYIDGQLAREDEELTKDDLATFYEFCQNMGMKSLQYDRFKQGERKTKKVDIDPIEPNKPYIKLVQ